MKKIYLAVATAIFATCAQAQSIHFMLGDQVLEEGVTIEDNSPEIYEDEDYTEWTFEPQLYVVTSEAANVDIMATCTTGQSISLCLGGVCPVPAPVMNIKNIPLAANSPEFLQFHFMGDGNVIPSDVEVGFFVGYSDNDDVYATMTLIMNKDGKAGTVKVFEKGDSLVSVSGALEYSVEGTSDLALYTTDGNRVLKQTVIGNGTVSTASLAKGVYVYTLGNKSGKLVVK